ncbi:MAG: hypothetical protein Kow00121_26050 [Elainellaceae cyanobacterium]
MRTASFIVKLLVLSALWIAEGCAIAPKQALKPASSEISPQVTILPEPQSAQSLTPEAADAMMAGVVDAINQERAELLVPYLLERDQDPQQVEAAIADYQTYFNGEPIAGFERLKDSTSSRFNYRIYNNSGQSKTIAINQAQSIRLIDEFLLYSRWAKVLVARFTTAIQAKDAPELAKVLSPDDLVYPQADAEQAIDRYASKFELETIQAEFVALSVDQQHFVYKISGLHNGQPVEHLLQVLYGDGLVNIQDEWVPAL